METQYCYITLRQLVLLNGIVQSQIVLAGVDCQFSKNLELPMYKLTNERQVQTCQHCEMENSQVSVLTKSLYKGGNRKDASGKVKRDIQRLSKIVGKCKNRRFTIAIVQS